MDENTAVEQVNEEFVCQFSLHSRRIYSFILALVVRPETADEVFQNTSLVLWKKFSSFTPGTSFWAWACQIAYYEVLRHRQETRRKLVFSDDVVHQIAATLIAREEQLSLRERGLHECLERLGTRDRDMIELRYFHGQAPKQIAALQSRSVHSIYRALSRIHGQLHRCINRFVAAEAQI